MQQQELKRSLGLISAISVTVGSVIGSGVFFKAWVVARNLPDETWIFGAWIALGLMCLFGAFAYGELGAMFPEAGGQYAFLREAWGRFPAFIYGWTFLLVINSGTLAALAAAFGENLASFLGLSETAGIMLSLGMILFLAIVNHFGVSLGALVQNLSTFAKLGALGVIVAGGFFAFPHAAAPYVGPKFQLPERFEGLIVAAMGIFWAYEGWYQLPFNAAELKRPERDLPRALSIGLVIVIVTYVLVNAVYLRVIPLDELRLLPNQEDVPRVTVSRIFGEQFGSLLAVMISISVLGAANPNLLSSPRAFYAMAKDGLAMRPMMYVHPRWRTPVWAIWSQALWAMALIYVLKKFNDLTVYVVFASLIFYALTVAGIYVLRARMPDRPRPYRCWGYPVTPICFILVALGTVVGTLMDPGERTNTAIGLGIIATGVPVYFLATRRARSAG